jgi:hypothetical protein
MASSGGPYQVHNSRAIARTFQLIQRQASREGRGQELLRAARQVYVCEDRPLVFIKAVRLLSGPRS